MDTFETKCRTNIEGTRAWLAAYPTIIASMGTGVAAAEALGEACARLEAFTRQVEDLLAERDRITDAERAVIDAITAASSGEGEQ